MRKIQDIQNKYKQRIKNFISKAYNFNNDHIFMSIKVKILKPKKFSPKTRNQNATSHLDSCPEDTR